ncbi:elongation factor P maturation arginine rhamnosyltransferase EarP [Quisquiliibacterium transsilvanicum]
MPRDARRAHNRGLTMGMPSSLHNRGFEMSMPSTLPDRRPDSVPLRLAIFCRVVDNYGDAGVCWRLARQLAMEHRMPVDLWIDRPQILAAIAPVRGPGPAEGVTVRAWHDAAGLDGGEQVVVSAFGCELPPPVRRRLAAPGAPLWVNLEYLSAEDWVDGCHGLASTRPADGAIEHFFYPGFGEATGGLLREAGLLADRDRFLAQGGPQRWLEDRGLAPTPGPRTASLFCYPDAPVEAWLGLLAAGSAPWQVLVPEGTADAAVSAFLGGPLAAGGTARRGALTLHRFELLPQEEYDRLLWSCDLNFVRGEDSWVRAHWAGRPFVWQPYPQDAQTRRTKLDAFLARFAQQAGTIDEAAELMRAWGPVSTDDLEAPQERAPSEGAPSREAPCRKAQPAPAPGLPVARAWPRFEAALPRMEGAYRRWTGHLAAQDDLATRLLAFCRDRL